MPANLIPPDILGFDFILGMDWLHYNRAKLDCYEKVVTFHRPGLPVLTFFGLWVETRRYLGRESKETIEERM